MITSAFLLKVVIFGLIASLVIPVIDFLMFFFRESRKPNRIDENRSTLNEWHPGDAAVTSVRTLPAKPAVEPRARIADPASARVV
jgi:hypothetical protein